MKHVDATLAKYAAKGDKRVKVEIEGPPEFVDRILMLLNVIERLGSIGASRGVYFSVDGDGADRCTVYGEKPLKNDKERAKELEDALDAESIGIGEKGEIYKTK